MTEINPLEITREKQHFLGIGHVVDFDTSRVVRSHRRPPSHLTSVLSLLVIGCAAAFIATSAVRLEPPSERPESPQTVAPLALPVAEPVDAPTVTSDPVESPPDVRTESTRASRAEQQRPVTNAAPNLSNVEKVIAFALAQQGDRYVFAASGPNSWDCSGLVMGAFAVVGVKLPHYTGTMLNYGKSVSRSEMVRGDAIWLAYNHVAIYLGNNQMVAASSGKGRVVVQTVYGFYAARRLL